MQTTQTISLDQLKDIVLTAFSQGDVLAKQTYSDFDSEIQSFVTSQELLKDIESNQKNNKSLLYSFYYPESKGHIFVKRIELIPEKCSGHTFRYSVEGWGWIHLQLDLRNYPDISTRICVNSPERASTWSDTYQDYRSPDLWDWPVVKKKAGKLLRLLRKYGK